MSLFQKQYPQTHHRKSRRFRDDGKGDVIYHRVITGLIEEVEHLVGVWGVTASQAVGYREMSRVVAGEWSHEQGRRRAIEATTALARRQRTYFRRDPRIRWLDWHDDSEAVAARVIEVFEEAGWTS